jgi:hypothetical protein
MPRFFFHIHDELDASDEEGSVLHDAAAARLHALTGARSLAAEQVEKGRLNLSHHIDVYDEAHRLLFTLPFSEAVEVRD